MKEGEKEEAKQLAAREGEGGERAPSLPRSLFAPSGQRRHMTALDGTRDGTRGDGGTAAAAALSSRASPFLSCMTGLERKGEKRRRNPKSADRS